MLLASFAEYWRGSQPTQQHPQWPTIVSGIALEPLRHFPLRPSEYLYEALAMAASGRVKVVTETYKLDEIGKAYERVEKGQVRFRAVVVM